MTLERGQERVRDRRGGRNVERMVASVSERVLQARVRGRVKNLERELETVREREDKGGLKERKKNGSERERRRI